MRQNYIDLELIMIIFNAYTNLADPCNVLKLTQKYHVCARVEKTYSSFIMEWQPFEKTGSNPSSSRVPNFI